MLSEGGVNLSEEDIGKFGIVLQSLQAYAKTSMLQDIEALQENEVEMLREKDVELGKGLMFNADQSATVRFDHENEARIQFVAIFKTSILTAS